ncbi:MAG TPA: YdeI/OmpD-associated family protein [Nakamurella sp.]
MVAERTFVGLVRRPDEGPGHAIAVPFDPAAAFGRVRAPVLVTLAGHPPFRTTLAAYAGTAWIGLRKAQLAEFGLAAGDSVSVTVEPDLAPRTVELPAELDSALAAAPPAREAFDRLSFSHRREYAQWVGSAKRADTRGRRAAAAVERLLGPG